MIERKRDYKEQIQSLAGANQYKHNHRVIRDTSDFVRFDYGDVVILDETPYLIGSCEKEGRFGIDDQPKLWVKRAINLQTGEKIILKFVFEESFVSRVGDVSFKCFRSAKKEAHILGLVAGHPHFMQGFPVEDSVGNIVRVLKIIKGKPWFDLITPLSENHEEYYFNHLKGQLQILMDLTKAISILHDNGEKHGDIRRDHILFDRESGLFRWIDFDYDYQHHDNYFGYDLFGLGNLLIFLVGGRDITVRDLHRDYPDIFHRFDTNDANIMFPDRIANLAKIYPYILPSLNDLLLVFSPGAEEFFDNIHEFEQCLKEVHNELN
jgi:serine/threonine protein kinase